MVKRTDTSFKNKMILWYRVKLQRYLSSFQIGKTKYMSEDIYALNFFIQHSGEHWCEQNAFCSFTTPPGFLQSSTPGALRTLMTSVVLYSLTGTSHTYESWKGRSTCLWMYTLWICSLSTLKNTDENRMLFVESPHRNHFGKT